MKRIVRPKTPPAVLSQPEFARMRQEYLAFLSLPEDRRDQSRPPSSKLPEVSGLLSAVAEPFAGTCAFCQIEPAASVYRFRPTKDARPERVVIETVWEDRRPKNASRLGILPGDLATPREVERFRRNPVHYGWLADAWQNLHPICDGCRPKDPSRFEILGERSKIPSVHAYERYATENTGRWPFPIEEEPVLLDPCIDDPEKVLRLRPDGVLEASERRGRSTIEFFNLNRPDLVRKRAAEGAAPAKTRPTRRTLHKEQSPTDWELSRIRIENFKAIETLDLDMPPRPQGGVSRAAALLILGENAAGKSTVLEAVALAMMPDDARHRLLDQPQRYLLNPQFMGDAETPAKQAAQIILDFVADGKPAQVAATLSAGGMTVQRGASDLPAVFAYGAYRHYLDGVRRPGPDRGVVSLFRSDRVLSNPRDWLLRMPADRFNEVIAALRFVFGVDFDAIRRNETDCIVITRTAGVETETPLLAVSSGFRTVLALVCDVLRWLIEARATRHLRLEEMPALILIDEVEAHLHPRWKMAIVDGLRRALPTATFLVTTHDPLCLRRAAPEEVRVVTRSAAEGRSNLPVLVEALDRLPEMGTLTVDQLLTADFFGLGDTDDPATVAALENLATQYASGMADPVALDVLRRLEAQVLRDLPIGRTEVERIVQEALSAYLTERRSDRPEWRARTRQRILNLLRQV